jgi:hypothetical protein
LKTLQSVLFPSCETKVPRAIKTLGKITVLRIFIFVFKWQMDRQDLQPNGMMQSTNLIRQFFFFGASNFGF